MTEWLGVMMTVWLEALLLLGSLALFAMARRWLRHGEWAGWLAVLSVAAPAMLALQSLHEAASGPPYLLDWRFWAAALVLGTMALPHFAAGLHDRYDWLHWQGRAFHAPPWFTWPLLILWPLIPATSQWMHLKGHWPWWIPVVLWAMGLWLLLRHAFSERHRQDDEGDALVPANKPLTFGSVSEEEAHAEPHHDPLGMSDRTAWYWVGGVMVLAALLYLVHPAGYPTEVHGDEGEVGLLAMQMRESGNWNPFLLGWFGIPHFFFLIPGWGMWLFGDSLQGLRLTVGLTGLFSIPLFYLASRRLFLPTPSLIGTFLFATSVYMIHFSRQGNGFNQTLIFTLLVFYSIVRGLQERQAFWVSCAGVVCAIGWLSYQANKLLPALAIAAIVVLWAWRVLRWRECCLAALIFLVSFAVAFAPLLGSYWHKPEQLAGRMLAINAYSTSPPGEEIAVMWRQLQGAVLAPLTMPDSSPFLTNKQYGGMLGPHQGIWLGAAFLPLLVCAGHPGIALLGAWLVMIFLIGGVMTQDAPQYQRLIGGYPLLAMMAAPVLSSLYVSISRSANWRAGLRFLLLGLLFLLMSIASANRYFHEIMQVPQMHSGSTQVAQYLQSIEPQRYVYFMGHPYYSMNYGNIRFLAQQMEGEDVPNVESFLRQEIERRGPIVFVMIRHNRRYVDALRELYPYGKELVFRDALGNERFVAYEVNL